MYLPVGIQATSAERILATALDLFAIKGYDATSVREICEAAGITKPTLYHFFGSKDGVFQALVRTGFQQYRALVDAALATPGSFQDRVKVLARAVFESASTQAALLALHAQRHLGAAGHGAAADRELHAVLRRRRRRAGAAAEKAVARGEIAPGPTGVRMLILMGAISEAATGFVIAGKPN